MPWKLSNLDVIERMQRNAISRRKMFSLLDLAVGTALAVRPTDAEAQTSGMERRQERVEKRYERRGGKNSQNPTTGTNQPAQAAPAQKQ
jgi:hypothetical protein